MEYKDENPKDAIGSTKVPMSNVPATFIAEVSLGLLEGKLKYGQVNWRAAPVRASVYLDALERHIAKFRENETRDSTSHVHHLGNAGACLAILVDAAVHGTLIDDRNYNKNSESVDHIDALSDVVNHLNKLHGDKSPKHWTVEDRNSHIGMEVAYEEVVTKEKKPAAKKRIRNRSK